MIDDILISQETADGLSKIGIGQFFTANLADRMAFAVMVMVDLTDNPTWFPEGKWATIQHIRAQLSDRAAELAKNKNK
jgi:hypothetical protein